MIIIGKPKLPKRDFEGSIIDLLESIALEEAALAHFINAEAEKMQSVARLMKKGKIGFKEVLKLQEKTAKMMRIPVKKQILLQFKLEDILDLKADIKDENDKCCY